MKSLVKGNFSFRKGDVRDKEFLRKIFEEYKLSGNEIELVIHFAGLKAVGESVSNPLIYWDVNINTTLSLLSIMDELNARILVVAQQYIN